MKSLTRLIGLAVLVGLLIGIFWGGAKPVAVGLFPSPYDKLVHFMVYGVIAWSLWVLMNVKSATRTLVAASLIGMLDEIHQIYLPGRSAGLDDLIMDVVGAAMVTLYLKNHTKSN